MNKIEQFNKTFKKPLSECEQQPEFHAEGDVYTHTMMVLEQLYDNREWKYMSQDQREILEHAVLLHDIAKPKTFTIENGVIRNPHHAKVGSFMARQYLSEYFYPNPEDFHKRDEVVNLICYHGRPPHVLEKENTTNYVIDSSWRLCNKSLGILAVCDMRGREGVDKQELIEAVLLWGQECDRVDCFDKQFEFTNNHARVLFYRNRLSNIYFTPHEKDLFDVYVMCGLPGVGKSHYVRKNFDLPIVSLDDLREEYNISHGDKKGTGKIIQEAKAECKRLLAKKQSFVFDGHNLIKDIRKKWLDIFFDYNARINIVYLEDSMNNILKRNKDRENVVPDGVIYDYFSKMEVPDETEAHTVSKIYEFGG